MNRRALLATERCRQSDASLAVGTLLQKPAFARNRTPQAAAGLTVLLLSACSYSKSPDARSLRLLTDTEMDVLTVGAAASASATAASTAFGSNPETNSSVSTAAYIGASPLGAAPIVNYAAVQTLSYASAASSALASSTGGILVDGGSGGAEITAAASANGTLEAQTQMQWYGVSTRGADLVFGSVSASACCGSSGRTQVQADVAAGGPYTDERIVLRQPYIPGRVDATIDAVVVSSQLPITDPAIIGVLGPIRASSKY